MLINTFYLNLPQWLIKILLTPKVKINFYITFYVNYRLISLTTMYNTDLIYTFLVGVQTNYQQFLDGLLIINSG